MTAILESVFKGLVQWVFELILEIVEYISNSLLDVFSMDMTFFDTVVPVTKDIVSIMMAVGWALLLGNLVFQATKIMAAGLGFEGEDPKLLFSRTFVFSFLLMVSRQICNIGLSMTAVIIEMLQVPSSVTITMPKESAFSIGASWLLVIIVGIVIMWQVIKFFFEIGERYVVTALLTILAPLAFGMGGSKNTEDIFKGWARMYGSMCLMMIFNVIFLKLLISALGFMPSGAGIFPWMILIVGIARVGRKIDSIITRIGLNPAITGDGLGRSLPGMLAYSVIRNLGSTVVKTVGKQGNRGAMTGNGVPNGAGTRGEPGSAGRAAASGQKRGSYYRNNGGGQPTQPNGANSGTQTTYASAESTQTAASPGTVVTPASGQTVHAPEMPGPAPAGTQGTAHTASAQGQGGRSATPTSAAGIIRAGPESTGGQSQRSSDAITRHSSVANHHTPGVGVFAAEAVMPGMAGSRSHGPIVPGARPDSMGTAGIGTDSTSKPRARLRTPDIASNQPHSPIATMKQGTPGTQGMKSGKPTIPGRASDSSSPQRPPIQRDQQPDGTSRSDLSATERVQAGLGKTRFTNVPYQKGKPNGEIVAGGPVNRSRDSSTEHRNVQKSSFLSQSRIAQTGQVKQSQGSPEAVATTSGVPIEPGVSTGREIGITSYPADPTQLPKAMIKQGQTLKGGAPPTGPTKKTQVIADTIRPFSQEPSTTSHAATSGVSKDRGHVEQTPSTVSKLIQARQERSPQSLEETRKTGSSPSSTTEKVPRPPQPVQGKGFRQPSPNIGKGTTRLKDRPSDESLPSSKAKKQRHERGGSDNGK